MADNGAHGHEHQVGTYTATEAADVLGLGKRRVLQMLERGELEGTKDELGRWVIPALPVHALLRERRGQERQRGRGSDPDSSESTPPNPEVGRELIDSLKDQVQHLRDQLATEQAANRENRRIIAGLIERIPELEPARDERGSPEKPSEEPPKGTAPDPPPKPQTATQRRPWWLRILGG